MRAWNLQRHRVLTEKGRRIFRTDEEERYKGSGQCVVPGWTWLLPTMLSEQPRMCLRSIGQQPCPGHGTAGCDGVPRQQFTLTWHVGCGEGVFCTILATANFSVNLRLLEDTQFISKNVTGRRHGFSVGSCEPELPNGVGTSLGPLKALQSGKAGENARVSAATPTEMADELDPFLAQHERVLENIGLLFKCSVKRQKAGTLQAWRQGQKASPMVEQGGDRAAYLGLGAGLTPLRTGT